MCVRAGGTSESPGKGSSLPTWVISAYVRGQRPSRLSWILHVKCLAFVSSRLYLGDLGSLLQTFPCLCACGQNGHEPRGIPLEFWRRCLSKRWRCWPLCLGAPLEPRLTPGLAGRLDFTHMCGRLVLSKHVQSTHVWTSLQCHQQVFGKRSLRLRVSSSSSACLGHGGHAPGGVLAA